MRSLQEQAEAMLETIDETQAAKKSSRLTVNDRALILRLAAKGNITQAEIAKAVGCDPATVCRTLKLLDTRKEARTILESGAAKLAQTVVDTDDAGIALKTLGKLDVVREDREGNRASIGPVIIVGCGDTKLGTLREGDVISLNHMIPPLLPGQATRDPVLCVHRQSSPHSALVSYPLPEGIDWANLPSGVRVDEEAAPFVEALSGTSVQRVPTPRVAVMIGAPPPGTPQNPIPVGSSRADDAA